ncbi:hypothetical protein C0585_00380 [Candidatus Woesearchaeota archaeon]|nr:MAG: hypothetical protein C0585_00380 [Candidatus Woesearchaeota archaeon]
MLWKTHLAFAFLLLIIGKIILELNMNLVIIFLVLIGSLFPDMDKKNSKLGRKAKIIGFIFDHRGFFHTVWALIIFSIIIHEIVGELEGYIFAIAYGSHLILDAITKKGIEPFYPLKIKVKGNIKSGGFFEKVLFYMVCLSICIFILIEYIH